MTENQTLVLIDGHSLAYRAYHALPKNMKSPSGDLTNAAFGFASMLLQVLEAHQPDHIAVTFDQGTSGRLELYPEYKANRAEMDHALRVQLDLIRELVDAFGIPIFEIEGWEADDILGTLARQAGEANLKTLIVTGDTDAFQLIDASTEVVTSGRRFSDVVIYDQERVEKRYGVSPDRLVQWKSLKGDPSDNIPGVPGVGEKTATNLIQEYGSVEEAIAHADTISGKKLGQALKENADQARLSVDLITIRRDAPVELNLQATAFTGYDRSAVMEVFRRLDFRSLVERLPAVESEDEPQKLTPEGEYLEVEDQAALEELAAILGTAETVCFDVETTSTDPMLARLVGLSVTDQPGRGWYVPVLPDDATVEEGQGRLNFESGTARGLPLESVVEAMQPVLAGGANKTAHNAKYDVLVLRRHGIRVTGPVFDTMIAAWLVDPGRRALGLKDLAWSMLGIEMTPITDLIGRGRSQITMAEVPVEDVVPYACADVDITLRLAEILRPELAQRKAVKLYEEVEEPVLWVLIDMEEAGIAVDVPVFESISTELGERARELEEDIFREAGREFNIGSPQQLGAVLFDEMGLPPTKRTKTGYSTSAGALADLAPTAPIVQDVLEWRHVRKLKSTYVDALPELVHPETGRIHSSWGQTSVVTGRLSSRDPNLQNIPVRTEVGGQIRRAFVAPDDYVLLAADYSQMELRILAALSGDEALTKVFETGGDVHAATGAFLFDKAAEDVTSNERRIAKMVNFGVLYGMGAFGLAQRTGLPRSDAAAFIERYFSRYESVKGYFDQVIGQAAEQGYVETILGRRRYFPELLPGAKVDSAARRRAEREAINAPIQGSAADITKLAMIELHDTLADRGSSGRLLLQVHDELLLEVPIDELDELAPLVRRDMCGAADLEVELEVDLSAGPKWAELEHLDV